MTLAADVNWKKLDGLCPAIVQDVLTRQVLMLGYMNREALEKTEKDGFVTFWSRSRQELWTKGETSGNRFKLSSIKLDCDQDTLLVEVKPQGPACHTGTVTCFGDDPGPGLGFLGHLERIIDSRKKQSPGKSYVARLFARGPNKPAQKVGEEGVEVAMAAVAEDDKALAAEAADLIFHLMVLLRSRGLRMKDVLKILRQRHAERAAS